MKNKSIPKGVLEDAKWSVLHQSDGADCYQAISGDKNCLILAEMHNTPDANELYQRILLDFQNIFGAKIGFLIESPEYYREVYEFPNSQVTALSSQFAGKMDLLNKGLISQVDTAIPYAIAQIDDILCYRQNNTIEQLIEHNKTAIVEAIYKRCVPELSLVVSIQTTKEVFSKYCNIDVDASELTQSLLKIFKTKDSFNQAIKRYGQIQKQEIYASNEIINHEVSKALKANADQFFILMGKYHLPALISSGPIAEKILSMIDSQFDTTNWFKSNPDEIIGKVKLKAR